jgi:hypothetical protein
MGKIILTSQRPACTDYSAPICDSDCCNVADAPKSTVENRARQDKGTINVDTASRVDDSEDIKELLIIGAGPHALSLLLRLLEPDADLLSDKDRHIQAEFRSRMRPVSDVYSHLKNLTRGPRATLKRRGKSSASTGDPPPLSLEGIRKSVLVVDSNGEWLSGWKQNFEALGIKRLRSLMNAHADPYDHRSLEYYAELKGREEELVTLTTLCQRDNEFRGPYQAPSTALFHDFHDLLARAYGIQDMVQKGKVKSINPVQSEGQSDGPIFEVTIDFGPESKLPPKIVKTRRIVCGMGPIFHAAEAFWEATLKKELVGKEYPSDRILHPSEIIPYLKDRNGQPQHYGRLPLRRLLIVGGGITSAQLAILAANAPWCQAVKIIQRSRSVSRHFDVENKWMGARRGQLLDNFWALDTAKRAQLLQEARLGGSIPPETLKELRDCQNQPNIDLEVQEEVQISQVHWNGDQFQVSLDDGSDSEEYDMIWLATGSENHLDFYSALSHLRKVLPVDTVNGLPVLNKHLSWRCPVDKEANEPHWKKEARKRFWCMGSLAGLELGPDALNLIGARHGAVRVAKDIRYDMMDLKEKPMSYA